MAEQEVHGGVEACVHMDREDQDGVPGEGDEVDQEEAGDEDADVLQLREEPQEKEIGQRFIPSIHVLQTRTIGWDKTVRKGIILMKCTGLLFFL